jgi:hypothetical protein
MTDYEGIKKICERSSRITSTVIDDFILHYAAAKDNLAREFDQRIATYKHITRRLEASWVNMLKSQYIVHRVFKADGLLRKYLNHVEIKRRPADEQDFLMAQLTQPWRFSFSIIIENPAPDFYRMKDVFSGESFLLYSRSTTQTLKEQTPLLWFNLIAFNGACWQTFGPVSSYQSFDEDDIFFFATEVNLNIEDEEMLRQDIERNPVPYMLLLTGSRFPVTFNKKDELLILSSDHDLESLDTEPLKENFKVEYNAGVYRLSLKRWDAMPHFAVAYYDEGEAVLMLTSMTERGFDALVQKLNDYGLDLLAEPQIRVHPTMLVTAEGIFNTKLELNPYGKHFSTDSSPEVKEEIEKMNLFLQLALPAINAGKKPDIEALAKQAGVDVSLAEQLVANIMEKVKGMRRGKR